MSSKLSTSSVKRSNRLSKSGEAKFNYEYEGAPVYCHCGLKSPLVTSNSDENLGRRFFGCSNYKEKGCKFFIWFDKPLENERVKELIIDLGNCNKDLVKENSILEFENKVLRKMVDELKAENGCLRRSSGSRFNDFCDEVVMLKAEIQVVEENLRNYKKLSRAEGNAKRIYKVLFFMLFGLLLWHLKLGNDSIDPRKKSYVLALP